MKRIAVEPPASDARRDRVERQVFAQLAAMRITDRADAVIPPPRRSRLAIGVVGAGLAAAAVLGVFLITRDGDRGGAVGSPSRVVTPVGATSQFTVPGALIEAKSDTSVEWQQGADGSITLVLKHGAVDCDVDHREGRPSFRVIAGEIAVVVVGTRFTVARTPTPRVDVARGKVRVEAPGGAWLVEAGEFWTPITQTATSAPDPVVEPPVAEPAPAATEIEMDPMRVAKRERVAKPAPISTPDDGAPTPRELAKESYRAAQQLERTDPKLAAATYRAIATDSKDPVWAANALVSLADVQIHQLGNPAAALVALDEHGRRFPRAGTREDAAWFRIEALHAMGKRDEARGATADYLREFPNGVYADRLSNR